MFSSKWINRFLQQANVVATWSKDTDSKVGAVLVSPDKTKFYHGYNGPPKGIDRLWESTEEKLKFTIHAELNALLKAKEDISGWTMFLTKPPCLTCCLALIQKGVNVVVPMDSFDTQSKWYDSQMKGASLIQLETNLTYTIWSNSNE